MVVVWRLSREVEVRWIGVLALGLLLATVVVGVVEED